MDGGSRTRPTLFFLGRVLSLASDLVLLSLVAVLLLTVLSRLGHLNVLGASLVVSDSMEPSIRRGDLVLYVNANYTVGDVVVYCLTPSHCVVHRVVDLLRLDTVGGDRVMVVTKGDNADARDSPVGVEKVRGRAVLTVPRELWLPAVLAALAYSLYGLAKTPIVGASHVVSLAVGLLLALAVFATVPRPIAPEPVRPPLLNLAGVYLDRETCVVSVRYTGELSLTRVSARVGPAPAEVVSLSEREVVLAPDLDLLREAFESGRPLRITVEAALNEVGRLVGEYDLLVGGRDPEVGAERGALVVRNPNCFPVAVNVSLRYYEGGWRWSNSTHLVKDLLVVEPPPGAAPAYAYVYWLRQGERRWVGLPLRAG